MSTSETLGIGTIPCRRIGHLYLATAFFLLVGTSSNSLLINASAMVR